MVSLTVLLLGLATLSWPTTRCAGRLRRLTAPSAKPRRPRLPRPTLLVLATTAGVLGFLLAGPGGALAASLATATAWRRWTARRTLRRTMAAVDGLVEALRSLVAELRAGAHPAAAAESAAVDAEPAAAQAMRSIAAAARLDGDIDRALRTHHATTPATTRALTQLAQAWTLVRRHGLALADVLDAVHHDLDTRIRFARLGPPGFVGDLIGREDQVMARKSPYSAELRRRAVVMVADVRGEYDTEFAAITSVAKQLGIGSAETLRKWVRQAEIDAGKRAGITREEAAEIRALKRRVAELERANEILKAASSYFARELDSQL